MNANFIISLVKNGLRKLCASYNEIRHTSIKHTHKKAVICPFSHALFLSQSSRADENLIGKRDNGWKLLTVAAPLGCGPMLEQHVPNA